MASLDKILKSLKKQWKETEPAEIGGITKYEDGTYDVRLEPARVELSKKSERLQIAWPMVFVSGKYKGKKVIKFDGLDNELNISWIKATMNVLGIPEIANIEELPKDLDNFFSKKYKGKTVSINIKTDGEYTNIYINGYTESDVEDDDKVSDEDEDSDSEDKDRDEDEKYSKNSVKVPTKKAIKKMSAKELKKVIKDHDLDIDHDDYDDKDELVDAVIEALEDLG